MTLRLLALILALTLVGCGDSPPAPSDSKSSSDAESASPARRVNQSAGSSAQSLQSAQERLQSARERYQSLDSGGGWTSIPAGDLVRVGDTAQAQVQALRDRLGATDELAGASPTGPVLDDALAAALAAFQERNGLSADSLLGGNTRTALNVPASRRVRQIDAMLDRWEDLPDFPTGPDARYIMVNVPEFTVRAFEGGREALQMKVVVGSAYDGRATPLFHDSLDHVIFGPYWNVPPSIATEELVPDGVQALTAKGFEIVSHYATDARVYEMTPANLRRVANGNLRIRQKPGPDNALGRVKFIFPNQYAVYLHDTPADALFDQTDRAASHGCIRLEDPAAFAEWVLGPQGWDAQRATQAMNSGERERVDLDTKIPVYIVYLTVYADDDGHVHFLQDIYDEYAEV